MTTYKELKVWQRSMDLVESVYKFTKAFPKEETYGLVSQMRRAAISIPSNIAEGAGRRSSREYVRFLTIAHGSCCEVETQALLAQRLGMLKIKESNSIQEEIAHISRMLKALQKSLQNSEPSNLRTFEPRSRAS